MNPATPAQLEFEELSVVSAPASLADARQLLLEYGRFVQSQAGVASFCYGALETEAINLPNSYLDQSGGACMARFAGRPVGFVAWRSLNSPHLSKTWEVKRLWVRPEARGSGLGRILMEWLIDRAIAAGKTELVLDTAPDAMRTAFRLYHELGFVLRSSYNGPPTPGIAYLGKSL